MMGSLVPGLNSGSGTSSSPSFCPSCNPSITSLHNRPTPTQCIVILVAAFGESGDV